jgi:chromosomal replication initiator protein
MRENAVDNTREFDVEEVLLEEWDNIKKTVQREYSISDISYRAFIKRLEIYEIKDDIITISVPSDNAPSINYLSYKYSLPIKDVIFGVLHKEYEIEFVLEKDLPQS